MKKKKRILSFSALMVSALSLSAATVCYDSNVQGGANDGSSWANAYSDLASAIAAAGDGGEVRVKQGVHRLSAGVGTVSASVKLVGGYTGSGDERSDDALLSVITGDVTGNDRYLDQNGTELAPVIDASDRLPAFRAPTATEGYWKLDPTTRNDNLQYFLQADSLTIGSYIHQIEGLTLAGFGRNNTGCVYQGGSSASLVMTNCCVIGNYALSARGAAVDIETDSVITDCRFLGNNGAAVVYGSGNALKTGVTSTMAFVRDCTIAFGYADQSVNNVIGCGVIAYAKLCHITVSGSTFEDLYADIKGTAQGPAIAVAALTGTSYINGVTNCTFRNLTFKSINTSVPATVNCNSGSISDCVFENCNMEVSNLSGEIYIATASGSLPRCRFSNCSLKYDSTGGGTAALLKTVGNELSGCVLCDNTVAAIDCANVYLVSAGTFGANQTPETNLSIVGNTVSGGTACAAIINTGTMVLMNSVIAYNKLVDYGTDGIAATIIRTGIAHVGWTTIYNNETPVEFYGNHATYDHTLYVNSSVIWRDADADSFVPAQSLNLSKGPIIVRHSCIKGVKEGDACVAATGTGSNNTIGLYTDDPLFAPVVRTAPNGGKYVMLKSYSPYRKSGYYPLRSLDDTASNAKTGAITIDCAENGFREVASNKNYHTNSRPQSDEPMPDILGAERTEGEVVLGAVQELYREDRTILTIQ